jgi:hypothetical protein
MKTGLGFRVEGLGCQSVDNEKTWKSGLSQRVQ